MKITEISATVGQTIQIKQYEPRVYSATVKMDVDESDNVDEAFRVARDRASHEVQLYFKGLKKTEDKGLKADTKTNTSNIKLMPEILTQPNIPKPIHGIAPRTIMGQTWWNKTRQAVYATTDYHCIACGVAKADARAHAWLEAHELWTIDYKKGTAEVKAIEPLCHYCHNFIHSGRLTAILGKEKSEQEVKNILEHGFKVLSDNKLNCFPVTLELAEQIGANTFGVTAYDMPESTVKWEDWKVLFEGKEYKSKFANYEEWEAHYAAINNKEK